MSDTSYVKGLLALAQEEPPRILALTRERGWDWSDFAKAADREGMGLYLAAHAVVLREAGCPAEKCEEWRIAEARYLQAREKNLQLVGELGALAQKERLRLALLKGYAFEALGLPHCPRRRPGDIDFIIPLETVRTWYERLREIGFARVPGLMRRPGHSELFLKWTPFENSLIGRDPLVRGNDEIDLHWNPHYYLGKTVIDMNLKNFWRDCTAVSRWPGICVPSDQYLLAHTLLHCAHSAEEEGIKLYRLFDVAALIKRNRTTLSALNECWQTNDKREIYTNLERYWKAAEALLAGETRPFLELKNIPRAERRAPKGNFRWKFFWSIGTMSDRWRFLTAYLKPPLF